MHTHDPSWVVFSSKAAANIGFQALIPAVIFFSIALVTVILRWYSRACLSSKAGTEDVLVTVALILSMAMSGVVAGEFHIDTDNTNDEVRSSSLETMMKLVFAQSLFYQLSINLVKASIVFQYLRLFSFISPVIRWTCFTYLFVIFSAAAWGALGVVFMCRPVQKYWKAQIPGECTDPERHFWSNAIIGIVLDFAIWVLPMPVIGRLKLPKKQKMGLVGVFGLGGFICIVSILRLALVNGAAEAGEVTKPGTHAILWSTIEVNVAIICASLLVMKPLFVRLWPRMMIEPPSARDDSKAFFIWATATTLNETVLDLRSEDGLEGRVGREERYVGLRKKGTGPESMMETGKSTSERHEESDDVIWPSRTLDSGRTLGSF